MRRRKRGGGYVGSLRFDDDKFDELMMMVDHPPSIKPKGIPSLLPAATLSPSFPRRVGISFLSFFFVPSDQLPTRYALERSPPLSRHLDSDFVPRAGR